MTLHVTRLLEIDVMQSNEITESFDLAVKHCMPAVVVHQDIISDAVRVRSIKQGKFKIITPVDWPKGEAFSIAKMQSMKIDALSTDGYEILLSPRKSASETLQEMIKLSEFIRGQLSPLAEVRFILGTFTYEKPQIDAMISIIKNCQMPNMIRNDHHTKAQQNKANIKVHQQTIIDLQKNTPCNVKICGNISLKTIAHCTKAQRFGVNLRQAQSIIKESEVRQLQELQADDTETVAEEA